MSLFWTSVFSSLKGAFLMFSFGPGEMGSFRHWGNLQGIQPSGAVWVNVESPPVFMFAAGMEGCVWTLVHLSSE